MPIAAPSPVAPAPVAPAPVAPTAPDADSYDGCYELTEYSSTEFDWENLYSDENGMTPTVSGPVATYESVPSNPIDNSPGGRSPTRAGPEAVSAVVCFEGGAKEDCQSLSIVSHGRLLTW